MTRSEHIAWAKKRAILELECGSIDNALASIASDLRKHPDTANHIGVNIFMSMRASGLIHTTAEARKFIEDFN